MLTKTTAIAAVIALSASSAFAGGLSDQIVEAPVMEEAVVAEPRINTTYVVVGVLAALLIAAAVGQEDDEEDQLRRPADGDGQLQPFPGDGNFPPDN